MSKYSVAIAINALDKATGPIKSVQRSLDRMKRPIANLQKQMANFRRVAGQFALPLIAGVGAATAAITALTFQVTSFGDEIAKTAGRLGLTTDALQEFRFAADQSGIGAQTFDLAFQNMTKKVGDAAMGNKAAIKSFQGLGVSIKDAKGQTKDAETIFMDTAQAISKIQDPMKRNALTADLFGAKAVRLVNLFAEGKVGIQALREQARELGIVIGKDALDASEDFNDRINELKRSLFGLSANILGDYLPAINKTIQAAGRWVQQNQGVIKSNIVGFITSAKAAFDSLREGIEKITPPIATFINAIGGLDTILALFAGVAVAKTVLWLAAMKGATIELGKAMWVFMGTLLTNPLGQFAVALGLLVTAGILLYKHWDTISKWFKDMWAEWGGLIRLLFPQIGLIIDLAAFLMQGWGPVSRWFADMWRQWGGLIRLLFPPIAFIIDLAGFLMQGWGPVSRWFGDMWRQWGGLIRALFPVIGWVIDAAGLVRDNWGPISNFFKALMDAVSQAFSLAAKHILKVWAPVKSFFDGLGKTVANLAQKLPNKNMFTGGPSLGMGAPMATGRPVGAPVVSSAAQAKQDRLDIAMKIDSQGRPAITNVKKSGSSDTTFKADLGYMLAPA
jgi:phage-related minor tail protein